MKFTVEIYNSSHETVNTMIFTYTGCATYITANGKEGRRESLHEFIEDMADIVRQELYKHPGHTALIYNPQGMPLAYIEAQEDSEED